MPSSPETNPVPPPAARLIVVGSTMLAVLLAGLSMLGPFAVDTYLPAFPAIQSSLHASEIEVQQTLTAYMLAFSVMILWHGALSDSFGRRNIVLMSLAVFAVATLGCAASHNIGYLWVFRILQGTASGAGAVIGRAIISDLYAGAAAARLLSLVTMIFAIAPAIAPILGGWIVKLLDWRSIFLFLFGYTMLLLGYCYKYLPESLPVAKRRPFNPTVLFASYRQIFRSPLFHLKAGTASFNFAGMFLYVAAAPAFITRHLGLGIDQFGWQFVPSVAGIFFGALTANRMAGKFSLPKQILIGFMILIGACLFNVLYHAFYPPALPWSVIPLFFYTMGMGMVAPGATLMLLDLFPQIRGTVASCQSATLTMLATLVAGVIAPLLSGSVLWLALGQLTFGLLGLMCWLGARWYRKLTPAA